MGRLRFIRYRRAVVGCVAATLTLASAIAATASTTSAKTPQVATSAKASTIKFGVIYTTGSPIENTGDVYAADEAAVRAINAAGGLGGKYRISLIGCNDQGQVDQSSTCAREMVSDHVAALMGGALLYGTQVNQILAAANIPEVGLNAQASAEFNAKNVFLFNGGGEYGWFAISAWAAHNKVPTSAVTADTALGEAFAGYAGDYFGEGGGKFKNVVDVSANAADFAPIVLSATSGGASYSDVLLGREQTEAFSAANQASGAPIKKILTAWSFSSSDESAVGGKAGLSSFIIGSPFPPFTTSDNAMIVLYRKELAAEKKAGVSAANVNTASVSAFQGWLAFQALNELVAQRKLTRAKLTAAGITSVLNGTHNLNLKGVMPPWTPSTPGPTGQARVPNTANYIIAYTSKGQPYLLTPKPLTIAQIVAGDGPKAPR